MIIENHFLNSATPFSNARQLLIRTVGWASTLNTTENDSLNSATPFSNAHQSATISFLVNCHEFKSYSQNF